MTARQRLLLEQSRLRELITCLTSTSRFSSPIPVMFGSEEAATPTDGGRATRKRLTMSELTLALPEKFDAKAVRAELSEHLKISEPQVLCFRSADPPSVIQLLGDHWAWLPISAAAVFFSKYLSTLGKRSAEATWDGLASLFNSNEVKPLADVSRALATAADSVDGNVTIVVGLNIPDDHFGTAISIKPGDPEEVGRVLASFIVHVEQISKAMKAEVKAGHTPLGRAHIELQDDGSLLVNWVAQDDDFSRHELKIPSA